jgi:N-acetylglucosamine malate deacetylase 2
MMEKERHVLVIFPHPDDEAFGVSGTISLHIDNGTPVTYACLTLGEMGRNMGNPPFATRESLPKIRKEELKEAARVLGIQDLRMLGYRDKTVEFEDEELLANRLGAIIGETNPSLIITFYPGYAVHPDHDATGAAVIRAVKELPAEKRPKVHCVAFSNNCEEEIGQADVVIDVSVVIDRKIAAIKAHASQTQLMAANMEESIKNQDPEVLARMYKERFWTYKI